MKLIILLLVTLLSFFAFVPAFSETAYFAFKTHGSQHDFVFELNDGPKIQMARDILSGKEQNTIHPMGRIKKSTKPYNPHYNFHFDPDTITFFQVSIEVCDATLPFVEENLDEACGAFLPGCFFCPWSGILTKEVKAYYV